MTVRQGFAGIRTAVAIGKFDGVHLGHKKLLDEIVSYKDKGFKSLVFTFERPFSDYFTGERSRVLTPNDEKTGLFEAAGIDFLYMMPVNKEMVTYDPGAFVKEILVGKLKAGLIAAGSDLSFGDKGMGNIALVRRIASELKESAYSVSEIEKIKYRGEDISSSLVRDAVLKGDMEKVRDMLGRSYSFEGEVTHGKKLGMTIGMPTANLIPADDKLMPPYGVYVSDTILNGAVYRSITNIGMRPTVNDGDSVTAETHIIGFSREIYGEKLRVELKRFIRPERRFDSLEALKEQMKRDITEA